MELTIGIPVYNARKDLHKLLSSIQQELADKLKLEVIVVDDGSSDGTAKVVPQKFPWIEFIHLEENVGIAKSTEIILQKMSGKYLLRLDADTRINAEAVKKLLALAEKDAEIGVLAPRLVDKAGNFQPSYETHFKHPLEWFWDYTLWLKKALQKFYLTPLRRGYGGQASEINFTETKPFSVAYMASAAVLINKKAIDEVGGIDPNMEFFMEDADWIWRINQTSWKVLYYPQAEIIHIGGQSGQLYIHTRDRSLKNLYYFYQKHCPGRWNRSLLSVAILGGSFLSLLMAVVFYPISLLNQAWREIDSRALKSFSNVFSWHLSHHRGGI